MKQRRFRQAVIAAVFFLNQSISFLNAAQPNDLTRVNGQLVYGLTPSGLLKADVNGRVSTSAATTADVLNLLPQLTNSNSDCTVAQAASGLLTCGNMRSQPGIWSGPQTFSALLTMVNSNTTATSIVGQSETVGQSSGGYVATLGTSTAGYPGYTEYHTSDGTRRAFIGYSDGSSNVVIQAENGWGLHIAGKQLIVDPLTTFNGGALVPTVATSDSSTNAASTAFVQAAIQNKGSGTPSTLGAANVTPGTFGGGGSYAFPSNAPLTIGGSLTIPTLGQIGGMAQPGNIDYLELSSYQPANRTGTSAANYDDGPALQAAYNALCARTANSPLTAGPGGTVHMRGNQYYFGTTTTTMSSCTVRFVGETASESPLASGTWFHINSTANTPFHVAYAGSGAMGTVAGTTFENFGIYQDQPTPPSSGTFTPTAYPVVFSVNTAGKVRFNEIHAAPVYDLLYAQNAGRLELGNISGQILHRAFQLDSMFDDTHLTGKIHFWPYWSTATSVYNYTYNNADGFYVGRADGVSGGDIFMFAMHSVLRFEQEVSSNDDTTVGYASRWNINSIYADSVFNPILVDMATSSVPQHYPNNIHIGSLHAANGFPVTTTSMPGSGAIVIGPSGAIDLSIDNLTVASAGTSSTDYAIRAANPNIPSQIRIGSAYAVTSSAAFVGMANITAANISQSTVLFGTMPILPGGLTQKNSTATVATQRIQSLVLNGVTNAKPVTTPWQYEKLILYSSSSTVDSVSIVLPANAYDGQAQKYMAGPTNFTNVNFTTTDSSGFVGTTNQILPNTTVTYTYSVALNGWVLG